MNFDLVLTDPALRGLDVADLNLRLLPGSVAEVQLDNVVFRPAIALAGDYNNNGIVDAADYVVWRKGLGTTYTQNDYNIWRAHFGQTAGSGSGALANAAVPEPATLEMLVVAAAGVSTRRRWYV
jgi:hypothetical protein